VPIEAFIFDMDDVLCTYNVGRRIEALAGLSGRSEAEIHAAIWQTDFLDRADRGDFSAHGFLQEFGRRLGYPLTRAEWVEARRHSMVPDRAMLALVKALGQHHQLALLTNNDRLLAETLDALFPELRPLFGTHLYVSAELSLAKPDPEIFRAVCKKLDVKTEAAFFIDDLAVNVAGAKEAGLDGHVFEGYRGFCNALSMKAVSIKEPSIHA
jgi:putative hydrolase of the HAD superfamily